MDEDGLFFGEEDFDFERQEKKRLEEKSRILSKIKERIINQGSIKKDDESGDIEITAEDIDSFIKDESLGDSLEEGARKRAFIYSLIVDFTDVKIGKRKRVNEKTKKVVIGIEKDTNGEKSPRKKRKVIRGDETPPVSPMEDGALDGSKTPMKNNVSLESLVSPSTPKGKSIQNGPPDVKQARLKKKIDQKRNKKMGVLGKEVFFDF